MSNAAAPESLPPGVKEGGSSRVLWMINHYALPPSRPGGVRHFVFARNLKRYGWDTTVIASSFDHTVRKELILEPGEQQRLQTEQGVPFLWVRTPPYSGNKDGRARNMLSFAWTIYRAAFRNVLAKPNAIFGSSPHLFGAYASYRLAKKLRVPFILEIRDLWPETLIQLGGYSPKHPAILALSQMERTLYRNADQIVTLLPYSAPYLVERGADPSRVTWIPNGMDLSAALPPNPAASGDRFQVFYTGTTGMANGLDTLLNAAKVLTSRGVKDVDVIIIGDGPELPRLRARVIDEAIPNVTLPGPVKRSEVAGKLQEASACVISLVGKGLFEYGVSPNKLFDYMAAARPVIFSVSASRNPVTESKCGISVQPDNPEALADAILTLKAATPEERFQMGLRGRMFVEEHHSHDRLCTRLAAALERALSSVGPK